MKQSGGRIRTKGLYGVAVSAVAIALVASACSSSGNKAATQQKPTATTSAQGKSATSGGGVTAAQADVAKYSAEVTDYPTIPTVDGGIAGLKGKSIWYVPLGGSLPIFQGFGAGIKDATTAAGMSFHTCDGKLVPTTMVSCLNQAATEGASAVISGYIDYSEAPTAYQNLIAHHIPVLIGGEPPTGGWRPISGGKSVTGAGSW